MAPLAGHAQGAPPPATPLRADPTVRTGTLPNGLRYYIKHNGWPVHRAELWLVVDAGSILEDDDQRGLAHFLEHMMFLGTAHFPKHQLLEYLQAVGMGFGADVNASTGYDQTIYTLRIPTDSAVFIQQGLQMLEDWTHAVTFDSAEFDRERKVVIEEWRMGLGVGTRVSLKRNDALLRGSRYATRAPIGQIDVLRTVSLDQLRRFYHDWYRPDLMAVVVVGDIDADAIERQVQERFVRVTAPVSERRRPRYAIPVTTTSRVTAITDPEIGSSVISAYVKHDATPETTVADVRRRWTKQILTAVLNARLTEQTLAVQPPYLTAGIGTDDLSRTQRVDYLSVQTKDGALAPGLARGLQELERIRQYGITTAELEREQASLLQSYDDAIRQVDHVPSRAFAAAYARWYLTGAPALQIHDEAELAQAIVPGITTNDVRALAATFRSEPWTVVAVAPDKRGAEVPSASSVLAIIDRTSRATTTPYQEVIDTAPLIAVPPVPGHVVSTARDTMTGAETWILSNGIRVLLKATDFSPGVVAIQGVRPGGLSTVPAADLIPASTATAIMARSGLGAYDLATLIRKTAGRRGSSKRIVTLYDEGVYAESQTEDLELALQLTYLQFTAPRRDTLAFLKYIDEITLGIDAHVTEPSADFADTVRVLMTHNHPLLRRPTPDYAKQLDLNKSYDFIRTRFGNAAGMTFVIIGAFSPEVLKPLVERYLASLPVGAPFPPAQDMRIDPPDSVVTKTVYLGFEPRSETELIFHGKFEDSAINRMQLTTLGDILQRRVTETLRQQLGGSYSPVVNASFSIAPAPRYTVQISFSADPARMPSLQAAVFSEIRKLRDDGPAPPEIADAKMQAQRNRETALRSNAFWITQMLNAVQVGWDLADVYKWDQLQHAVTTETIRDAARRYLDTERYAEFTLYPKQ